MTPADTVHHPIGTVVLQAVADNCPDTVHDTFAGKLRRKSKMAADSVGWNRLAELIPKHISSAQHPRTYQKNSWGSNPPTAELPAAGTAPCISADKLRRNHLEDIDPADIARACLGASVRHLNTAVSGPVGDQAFEMAGVAWYY